MRVLELDRVGHVTAYLQRHHIFRETITQLFHRAEGVQQ
ncbi:unnamed protein product [Strongylus vulgaris]|uniref:Uncharacterized protein n=1 Tax=Strongylus vulgaris TaxID=40348 RepID=A0A3P7J6L8_STRVU|nr:unnamed protein product [Strongylus vulgaris]